MYKVWKISSILTLIQVLVLIIIVLVSPRISAFNILRDMGWVTFVIAIFASLSLMFRGKSKSNEIRLVIGVAFVSTFTSDAVAYYIKFWETSVPRDLVFCIMTGVMVGIYLGYIDTVSKRINSNTDSALTTLYSIPLGFGMIFGGIAGLIKKKF